MAALSVPVERGKKTKPQLCVTVTILQLEGSVGAGFFLTSTLTGAIKSCNTSYWYVICRVCI